MQYWLSQKEQERLPDAVKLLELSGALRPIMYPEEVVMVCDAMAVVSRQLVRGVKR